MRLNPFQISPAAKKLPTALGQHGFLVDFALVCFIVHSARSRKRRGWRFWARVAGWARHWGTLLPSAVDSNAGLVKFCTDGQGMTIARCSSGWALEISNLKHWKMGAKSRKLYDGSDEWRWEMKAPGKIVKSMEHGRFKPTEKAK
ncbi:hypothetical protein FDECE_15704 [Fusarium decemcellulare]|nr:hypothetical protein FDECE_15704 [Fusarium decemcellulare]